MGEETSTSFFWLIHNIVNLDYFNVPLAIYVNNVVRTDSNSTPETPMGCYPYRTTAKENWICWWLEIVINVEGLHRLSLIVWSHPACTEVSGDCGIYVGWYQGLNDSLAASVTEMGIASARYARHMVATRWLFNCSAARRTVLPTPTIHQMI